MNNDPLRELLVNHETAEKMRREFERKHPKVISDKARAHYYRSVLMQIVQAKQADSHRLREMAAKAVNRWQKRVRFDTSEAVLLRELEKWVKEGKLEKTEIDGEEAWRSRPLSGLEG